MNDNADCSARTRNCICGALLLVLIGFGAIMATAPSHPLSQGEMQVQEASIVWQLRLN